MWPTHPFSTPWKHHLTVFWCFQGLEKRYIGNEWVNGRQQINNKQIRVGDIKFESLQRHMALWVNSNHISVRLGNGDLEKILFCGWWNAYLMNKYFTRFSLLTHLGVNNIPAIGVLNNNRLSKCTIDGDKQLQKRGRWLLWTVHTKSKKHDNFEGDWLEQEQDNLQRFFWMFWNLLKEIILKNNNQINSTVTTRTWVLSTEWTRTWANAVLLSKWKNNGGLRLLEWSMSFFRNRMNKDEGNEMQCKCDYFWSIQRKADHPQVV